MTLPTQDRKYQFGWFALAFGLALAIRLLRLGELPLSDEEARLALVALDFTRGLKPAVGIQPGYVTLTALAFFVLQASNFAARLIPAVFGAMLTITPAYFQDRLGSKAAIILAFFLAVDPAFLGLSRLAGSPVIAVTSLVFALATWRNGNWRAAGIWAGLALLGGPALWPGILGLAVTFGLLRGWLFKDTEPGSMEPSALSRNVYLTVLAYALGTYFVLGSFFLLASGGLSAVFIGISTYLSGWVDFSDVSFLRPLFGLAGYELLPVILGLAGLIMGIRRNDKLTMSLGVWLGVTFILMVAYPSRQMQDIVWVLIPLLVLAAREFASAFSPIVDGAWETIGMAVFTSAILIFAFMNYAAIALNQLDPKAVELRWWVLLGSLALLAISIAMVAFGWSVATARQGSVWGVLAVLVLFTLACSMASAGLRTYRTVEMWNPGPQIGQSKTLLSQLNDFSRWKNGVNGALDITVVGLDSPALEWLLRDYSLTISSVGAISGAPSVVIATDQYQSEPIQTSYRGQDLSWRLYPAWNQGLPADWMRWSILHLFPSGEEKIILWVRNDMFIDSQNNP